MVEESQMTRRNEKFEVLVDIPGLTLVRVDGAMKVDVVPGFRTREETRAILSEFGEVSWPEEDPGQDGGPEAGSP
jgi:hypothetical protein